MRFALLGNHPGGIGMSCALAATGRHQLVAYSGPARGTETLRQHGLTVKPIGDLEEILADPAVELVIVAGRVADRPVQLRRTLQSERPALCVHPVDASADVGYEAAMLQQDTSQFLLPLLPEALHPGVLRLAGLIRAENKPFGPLRLIELERWSPGPILIDTDPGGHKAALPGWDVLRTLCGEIAEVSAFAPGDEIAADAPLLLSGRFENGPLFRAAFLPQQTEARWRLTVTGSQTEATLDFPQGWPGPASLTWRDPSGERHAENWPAWEPWSALVEVFETAMSRSVAVGALPASGSTAITTEKPATRRTARVTWQDAVRCLELDGAARRSVHYRRASTLEYQEASEEVGFKGTMTLVGCGLLWGALLLLILSRWNPYLGWLIAPLLAVFLGLQLLRWIIPPRSPLTPEAPPAPLDEHGSGTDVPRAPTSS